jgi:hypothetical protein
MTSLLGATSTTLNQNKFLLHVASRAASSDLKDLPEFWPAGVALVLFLLLLRAKRRQDRRYRNARSGH